MNLTLETESVMTVCGPSGSGKTVFVEKLIKHRTQIFRNKIKSVHWFFGIVPPSKLEGITLHQGLQDGWTDLIKPYDMVIIDDLFVESGSNKELTNAFTRLAHHRPCFLVYLTQNLFHKSGDSRTRNLNTHYLVLMKNPRDAQQISYISRQMYPGSNFLVEVFRDVTEDTPFSYVLLDFRQTTPSSLRVRTGIFPGEIYKVYINKRDE